MGRWWIGLACAAALSWAHAAKPVAKPGAKTPAKPVEVVVGHQLQGAKAQALADEVERFNAERKGVQVELRHLRPGEPAGEPPHLALVDEDTGYLGGRRLRPMYQFMAENGQKLDASGFYPALRDASDDARGRLQSLPLALSLPVLYYNKALFRKVGLDPEQPPRTWWTLQKAAGVLYESGVACPYASSWPVWVHLENTSTQHNEPFIAVQGKATRLAFNSLVHVKHIALLSSWFKSRYFHLFGDADEADAKFAAGECAMLTSGSAFYPLAKGGAEFEVGMAELPYYDDVYGATPGKVVPAGHSLWVLAGKPKAENRVAAQFVAHLLKAETQKRWVEATGFLPMTSAAGVSAIAGLNVSPAQALARRLTERKAVTEVRLREGEGYRQVRAILQEELAEVWGNRKPAKEALDTAVRRGTGALNGADKRG